MFLSIPFCVHIEILNQKKQNPKIFFIMREEIFKIGNSTKYKKSFFQNRNKNYKNYIIESNQSI